MVQPKIQLDRPAVEQRLALYPRRQWAALLRSLELEGVAPARSTFYLWAKDWDERTPPESSRWTIMSNATERPDVVLSVLAAVHEASSGRLDSISEVEAAMVVALVAAKPALMASEGHVFSVPGLSPWLWAQRYLRAKPEEYPALDLELAQL